MFKNNNRKISSKLAKRSFKANRTRNIFALLAIVLTTVLFTAVFTIGMSLIESMENATMRQVGTKAHGGFKYLTKEETDKLKKHPLIKEYGATVIISDVENKELRSNAVELRYMDENWVKWGFCEPTTGKLPEVENEISTATWVLDMLNVPHKIGEKVKLEYTIMDKKYTKDFVLSGFWKGDKAIAGAGLAIVSKEFVDKNLKNMDLVKNRKDGKYTGLTDLSVMFDKVSDTENNLKKVIKDTGISFSEERYAVNWGYLSTHDTDLSNIIPFIIIGLLIMFSGYLLIYNIFYISVVKDTKYYGLLKTIGTTKKQLKCIIRKQAFMLSLIGIPIGLFCGYFIGVVLVPIALSTSNMSDSTTISINPIIFVGSALFSLVTVFLSSNKPGKIASKVSPIEAVRYTGIEMKNKSGIKNSTSGAKLYKMAFSNIFRNKKKAIIVLASLSLSIILFNFISSLIGSFNMDLYLKDSIRGDFVISDFSNFGKNIFNGANTVDEKMCNGLKNIQGVKKVDKIYSGYAHDKVDAHKLDVMKKASVNEEGVKANMQGRKEVEVQLYGLDSGCMDMYNKNTIIKGEFNLEKFSTGKYILINQKYECNYYDIGDKITLNLKDGGEKTFEVMALVEIVSTFDLKIYTPSGYNAYIPSKEFTSFIKKPVIMTAQIFIDKEKSSTIENHIKKLQSSNKDLEYRSKKDYEKEYKNFTKTFSIIGYSLSAVIFIIGLMNFVNTMLTSILARKQEFAILESVGMTRKQLLKMLIFEGLYYALITIAIVSTVGIFITHFGISLLCSGITIFKYNFKITPIVVCSLGLMIFAIFIPKLCYGSVSKNSIIERLRENE
ncbi:FtsX-like permease family protein [Clostridium tagluense]|uniref:Efflux ABC transporter permease n=1 Tax=Clostridium tagluense TaxID=360422 RepID=A0A401UUQ0_9CLOT|nr:FtsX-like permease family protein [Clostridium tagluense]GCD13216.1 efflux ABC transporter permease [Clostridium tagluense]